MNLIEVKLILLQDKAINYLQEVKWQTFFKISSFTLEIPLFIVFPRAFIFLTHLLIYLKERERSFTK